jgi:hypothetical protein
MPSQENKRIINPAIEKSENKRNYRQLKKMSIDLSLKIMLFF